MALTRSLSHTPSRVHTSLPQDKFRGAQSRARARSSIEAIRVMQADGSIKVEMLQIDVRHTATTALVALYQSQQRRGTTLLARLRATTHPSSYLIHAPLPIPLRNKSHYETVRARHSQLAIHKFYFSEAHVQKHAKKESATMTQMLGYYVHPFEGLMSFARGGTQIKGTGKYQPTFAGTRYPQTTVAALKRECFEE